jgi:hypothetical protein
MKQISRTALEQISMGNNFCNNTAFVVGAGVGGFGAAICTTATGGTGAVPCAIAGAIAAKGIEVVGSNMCSSTSYPRDVPWTSRPVGGTSGSLGSSGVGGVPGDAGAGCCVGGGLLEIQRSVFDI